MSAVALNVDYSSVDNKLTLGNLHNIACLLLFLLYQVNWVNNSMAHS